MPHHKFTVNHIGFIGEHEINTGAQEFIIFAFRFCGLGYLWNLTKCFTFWRDSFRQVVLDVIIRIKKKVFCGNKIAGRIVKEYKCCLVTANAIIMIT